jgi:hypothetical protein
MNNGFTHEFNGVTWYLNTKLVDLRGNKTSRIYYFSKDFRPETACELPEGKKVSDTGKMPLLKNA